MRGFPPLELPLPTDSGKVYAGVGSRRTPADVLMLMTGIGRRLNEQGFVLRTGGAPGADAAFLERAVHHELYLPWPGFNGYSSAELDTPTKAAQDLVRRFHPTWERLDSSGRLLHARNAHIALGKSTRAPVSFVVCWTPDGATDKTGRDTGGTGMVIRIASFFFLPVYNLALPAHREFWENYLSRRPR